MFFKPQYQSQRRCFSQSASWKKALRDSLTRAAWLGPSNFWLVRSEHAHASYPGLSFRPLGFIPCPIRGGKKRDFRDWTKLLEVKRPLSIKCPLIAVFASPRMPRHIRELFVPADAKIQNRLEKSANNNNNKEYGQKAATSVYAFLFHGHIYFSGQRVSYGNCRERIDKWFWTKIVFIRSLQVLSNSLWKQSILGAF